VDDYPFRIGSQHLREAEIKKRVGEAQAHEMVREPYAPCTALLDCETERLRPLFSSMGRREDMLREFAGLDWSLGVVDLRCLLAFQRRLALDPNQPMPTAPQQEDWAGLLSLAIGLPKSTACAVVEEHPAGKENVRSFRLHSSNPDFQLRRSASEVDRAFPFTLYGGSPFFEVAEFRGRWFLRDGYHRAYHLLRSGNRSMIAVVIHASRIEEVGATQPWFFSEEVLFSSRPPRVVDFLDEDLTIGYQRPRLEKTLRIQIEEDLQLVSD
jgi:hypothetical protein